MIRLGVCLVWCEIKFSQGVNFHHLYKIILSLANYCMVYTYIIIWAKWNLYNHVKVSSLIPRLYIYFRFFNVVYKSYHKIRRDHRLKIKSSADTPGGWGGKTRRTLLEYCNIATYMPRLLLQCQWMTRVLNWTPSACESWEIKQVKFNFKWWAECIHSPFSIWMAPECC